MDLIAIIDGQARPALTSRRPGDEVTVDLNGTQHSAKIVITVDLPDESCHVNLSISKAVLRN